MTGLCSLNYSSVIDGHLTVPPVWTLITDKQTDSCCRLSPAGQCFEQYTKFPLTLVLVGLVLWIKVMRESNRNLYIPPPAYPQEFRFWRFDQVKFPTYICNSRSNTIGKNWSSNTPTPWTNWHFVILELQSFSFLQKLSSIVQSRFLAVNQGQS